MFWKSKPAKVAPVQSDRIGPDVPKVFVSAKVEGAEILNKETIEVRLEFNESCSLSLRVPRDVALRQFPVGERVKFVLVEES